MKQVFSKHASLSMQVKTSTIDFPDELTGLDEITKTLVQNFHNTYENVYTFCLNDSIKVNTDTSANAGETLQCRWLVGMTDKNAGSHRVGFGDYEWHFEQDRALVKHLTITIEDMIVLPKEHEKQVFIWLSNLTYPWISAEIISLAPEIKLLEGLKQRLIAK